MKKIILTLLALLCAAETFAAGLRFTNASDYVIGGVPNGFGGYNEVLVTNPPPKILQNWTAALAMAQKGLTNAVVAFIGDSTTRGYGGGINGATNCVQNSWVQDLEQFVPNGSADCFMGNGVEVSAHTNFFPFSKIDSRLTYGTNWLPTDFKTTGGTLTMSTAGLTNPITFTPNRPCNFVRVLSMQNGGVPTAAAIYDGATKLGDIGNTSLNTITNRLFVMSANTSHIITIVPYATNTSAWYFNGIVTGVTSNSVDLVNCGTEGATSAEWASAPANFQPLQGIAMLHPSLTFVNLGINDLRTGVYAGVFKANLNTICTNLVSFGTDVILVVPNEISTGGLAASEYRDAIYAVAKSLNLPVLPFNEYLGNYATATAYGKMFDSLHPSQIGYMQLAAAVDKSNVLK